MKRIKRKQPFDQKSKIHPFDAQNIAFRFHDRAPMVGYRSTDGIFYIIWFDRNFTLYTH